MVGGGDHGLLLLATAMLQPGGVSANLTVLRRGEIPTPSTSTPEQSAATDAPASTPAEQPTAGPDTAGPESTQDPAQQTSTDIPPSAYEAQASDHGAWTPQPDATGATDTAPDATDDEARS